MTSGVRRQRVSPRSFCLMISWAAAKQIRCVNPSMTSVSPSETWRETASRIDITFGAVTSLAHGVRNTRVEHRETPVDVLGVDHQRWCQSQGAAAGA